MRRPIRPRRLRPWRRPVPLPPPLPPRWRWRRTWRRGCCLPGCVLPLAVLLAFAAALLRAEAH